MSSTFENYISNKDADAKETASDVSIVGGIHIDTLQLDILDASEARTGISNSLRLPQTVTRRMERSAKPHMKQKAPRTTPGSGSNCCSKDSSLTNCQEKMPECFLTRNAGPACETAEVAKAENTCRGNWSRVTHRK